MAKIVEACSDLGVHVKGSELGPVELIKNENYDSTLIEYQDVEKEYDKDNKRKNFKAVNEFNERLYNEIVDIKDKVLTLGGDHSIAIGSALASKKKHNNIGIIWIDAHSDFHTLDSTISGNIHGMPFATICGQNGKELSYYFDGEYFNPKNAVLVGGRDIEDAEYVNLKKAGVKIFTTKDIKEHTSKKVMEEAFKIALDQTDGVHISYDIDVIDPDVAPGVSVKAANGINEEEAYIIADTIIEHKKDVKSIDLVEFNPLEDIDNKTYKITKNILNKLINY